VADYQRPVEALVANAGNRSIIATSNRGFEQWARSSATLGWRRAHR
jgi:hypothetical protein